MRFVRTLVVLLLCGIAPLTHAYTSPGEPTGYVNDFANVISVEEQAALEERIKLFTASTTNEITVVTVDSIGDEYIENYARLLFEEWGIGTKARNNGVLLLLSVQDRELRIEVGYGLEGALPDSVADSIIRNDMVPLLKEGKYGESAMRGVQAIIAATQGEYRSEAEVAPGFDFDTMTSFLFGGFVILQWLFAIVARTKSWWLGGILGLVIGVVASSLLGWWLVMGLLSTGAFIMIGLILDFLVSRAYRNSVRTGSSPPWWGGGSGGIGGRSSGGFGGFGGGRSGGGGASGRW